MGEIFKEVDVEDLVGFIDKKGKIFQRVLLDGLEDILKDNPEKFLQVRKLVLDSLNNYKRAILKIVFGHDFEE